MSTADWRSDYYCQPRYAVTMNGFGVDIHAPRMPYVTTTVLFRPFAFIWRPLLRLFVRILGFVYQVFSDEIPKGSGAREGFRAATSHGRPGASVVPDWSMRDDGYI